MPHLPLKERRLDEEKLLFGLALTSARKRVILSYPRMERTTGKLRLPSSFLIAVAEAKTGEFEDYDSIEKKDFTVRLPVSSLFPEDVADCLTEEEIDLSLVSESRSSKQRGRTSYLKALNPYFARGALAENQRWGSKRLTPFDGVLNNPEALEALQKSIEEKQSTFSPTELEQYADCPLRYFFNHVLGLEEIEEPEFGFEVSSADRGIIVHDILRRFLDDAIASSELPIAAASKESLIRHAESVFREFENEGPTGLELIWKNEKRNIMRMLDAFHRWESEQEEIFLPTYIERPFGPSHSQRSSADPVPVTVGKTNVQLRGRIDRIDISTDNRTCRVIDYKSGKKKSGPKKDSIAGGTALQLPLYMLAAEQLIRPQHPSAEVAEAFYLYVLDNMQRIEFTRADWNTKLKSLERVISAIIDGIRKGLFFLAGNGTCKYCEMKLACRTPRDTLFQIKSTDPVLKRYLRMVDSL